MKEAADLGSELLRTLKPRGVGRRGERSEAEVAASDARDRMAVVVARRYAYVERIAGFRWGRELGAAVPAMLSREVSRSGAEADEGAEDELNTEEEELDAEEAAADTDKADARKGAAPDEDTTEVADAPAAAAAPAATKKSAATKKAAATKKSAATK